MYKKYCFGFLFLFSALAVLCIGVNSFVDPFNYVGYKIVDFVSVSNERNIKSIYLKNNPSKYDSVMVVSSRSSYINVGLFKNYKMFNFSVSGISIEEYLPYLKFFERTQQTPSLIILSFDFHSTNRNLQNKVDPNLTLSFGNSKFKQWFEYIKIKTLYISLSLISKAPLDYYDRDFVKRRSDKTNGLNEEIIKSTLINYGNTYLKNYQYDENYKETLKAIKNSFSKSVIIVVICPIHESLLSFQKSFVGNKIYMQWLNDLKEVFDNVIDFNQNKNIVCDATFFFDAAHFYPFIGDYIVRVLTQEKGI